MSWMKTFLQGIAAAFVIAAIATGGGSSDAVAATCSGTLAPGSGEDLEVTGTCTVEPSATAYRYGNVNIYGKDGKLIFKDGTTTFWAKSILVESGGSLLAGVDPVSGAVKPIGSTVPGAVLTIYLYGAPQNPGTDSQQNDGGKGITCRSNNGATNPPCGIDPVVWASDGGTQCNRTNEPTDKDKCNLPGGVIDYFYQYHPLTYDDGKTGDAVGYFGYKVLAVSYNGILKLFGQKGVKPGALVSSDSGYSWVRLAKSLKPTEKTLTVDRAVDWAAGDRIVVTGTDYLPAHSEQLQITGISDCSAGLCQTFDFVTVDEDTDKPTTAGVANHHNGTVFDLSGIPDRIHLDIKVDKKPAAETRAAVALLSRSIRIVSAGNELDKFFPDKTGAAPDRYFGGHTIVRQGFQTYQMQGVEFRWLGQGGRIAHYPVHFHMARTTPSAPGNETFVMDTSVNESMTRWSRPARHPRRHPRPQRRLRVDRPRVLPRGRDGDQQQAPVQHRHPRPRRRRTNAQNPREVPGILAAKFQNNLAALATDAIPFYSDIDHPTMFWIMNGWNDFEYNMAAGAGTCGVVLLAGARGEQLSLAAPEVELLRGHSKGQHRPAQRRRSGRDVAAEEVRGQLLLLGHEFLQHRQQRVDVPGGRHRRWSKSARHDPRREPPGSASLQSHQHDGHERADLPGPVQPGHPRVQEGRQLLAQGRRGRRPLRHALRHRRRVRHGQGVRRHHAHGSEPGRVHGHRARQVHLVLSLGGDELRGHLAAAPVVSDGQQRALRRAKRRPRYRDRRGLHLLRSHPRALGAGPEQRLHRHLAGVRSDQEPHAQLVCRQHRTRQPQLEADLRHPPLRRPLSRRQGRRQLPDEQLRRQSAPVQYL